MSVYGIFIAIGQLVSAIALQIVNTVSTFTLPVGRCDRLTVHRPIHWSTKRVSTPNGPCTACGFSASPSSPNLPGGMRVVIVLKNARQSYYDSTSMSRATMLRRNTSPWNSKSHTRKRGKRKLTRRRTARSSLSPIFNERLPAHVA